MALHEAYLIEIWVTLFCYLIFLLISLDVWRRKFDRLTGLLFFAALTGLVGRSTRLFGGSIFGYEDLDLIEVFVWVDITLWTLAVVFTTLYILSCVSPKNSV